MDHPALKKNIIFIQKSIDSLFAQNGMTKKTTNYGKQHETRPRFGAKPRRKGIMIRVGYHHCLEQTWETH